MLSKKTLKLWLMTGAVCLAGLSMSNLTIKAREESIEDRLFKRLEFAIEQGRLQESKEDIKRVLKLNPRHPGATFYAGKYSFANKDFDNARKFLTRVENHNKYGIEARKLLAEIRMDVLKRKFVDNLDVAIKGEAFTQALKISDEILAEMPENKDVMLLAAYAATMNSDRDKAEAMLERFKRSDASREAKAELQAFINAMFSAGYSPQTAVEQLMSVTEPRLMTLKVRNRLKDLIVSLKELDRFEKFIQLEKSRPGAEVDKLERELIEFLIEQKQLEKAMLLVNQRPANNLEDNILYLRLLVQTGQETQAMLNARQLISANPEDLRVYDLWTEAWLAYVDRTKKTPEGKDATGKSFDEMAEEVLNRLKIDRLVKMQPSLLLRLLRLAVLSENENKVKEIRAEVVKIRFDDKTSTLLEKTIDDLITINRTAVASEILESARNQFPEEHKYSIKLAEIYYINRNPEVAGKILEQVLEENPEQFKAYLLWIDCLAMSGKAMEAENAILKRLQEPGLNDLVQRQLSSKLEIIRMQNMVDHDHDYEQLGSQKDLDEPDEPEDNRESFPEDTQTNEEPADETPENSSEEETD